MTAATDPVLTALPPVVQLATQNLPRSHFEEFEAGECYPAALAELFIQAYSRPGDLVFDPFCGSGTTLVAAQRLQRRGLGLEIHAERVEWCSSQLSDPSSVRHANAFDIAMLGLPNVDLVMTSPPYMTMRDHPENPLTGYQTNDGDYRRYVADLARIFVEAAALLTTEGYLVINVANMCLEDHITPLAWDLAAALSSQLAFEREIVIDWDRPADWITNDYCLIYRRPKPPVQ